MAYIPGGGFDEFGEEVEFGEEEEDLADMQLRQDELILAGHDEHDEDDDDDVGVSDEEAEVDVIGDPINDPIRERSYSRSRSRSRSRTYSPSGSEVCEIKTLFCSRFM